jgi:Family of unknown function (DUF6953)
MPTSTSAESAARPTPTEAATWMWAVLQAEGRVDGAAAAAHIAKAFGRRFVARSRRGGLLVGRSVINRLRIVSGGRAAYHYSPGAYQMWVLAPV